MRRSNHVPAQRRQQVQQREHEREERDQQDQEAIHQACHPER
jgi:hypothetical protein